MGMGYQGTFCLYKALHYFPFIFGGKDLHRKMVFDIKKQGKHVLGLQLFELLNLRNKLNFPKSRPKYVLDIYG